MTPSSARLSSPDQLSLRLDESRPGLPRDLVETLHPMLARAVLVPFDSPDHLFEPRWGGLRALAFVEGDTTTLVDRRGRDVGAAFPELTQLAAQLAEQPAVLDGEIIVAGANGLADAGAIDERLSGRRTAGSVTYLVSDLLVSARRLLLGEPLERRRDLLRRLLTSGGTALLVPAVRGDGIALHHAVVEQGLDGTIGRHRRSPYLPGVRSDLWRFVERAAPILPPPDALTPGVDSTGAGMLDGVRGSGPIVAVLSRLPLGEPEVGPQDVADADAPGPAQAAESDDGSDRA